MSDTDKPNEGELILYQTPEGTVRIEVLYESETFWLSQKKIADLFGVELPTISYHLKTIYESGELRPDSTLRRIRRVQREGNREVAREIEFYNLDAAKPSMGLTTWKNAPKGKVLKSDVSVAKNYLIEQEQVIAMMDI